MFMTITDKSKHIDRCNVEQLPINYAERIEKRLFGKKVLVHKNPWLWHLHLKCTDICNAKCGFCVEKCCRKDNQNSKKFLDNTEKMLTEMENNGMLFSVSVTGGEPTLFSELKELIDVLKGHKIQFLTMNTNGAELDKYIKEIDGLFDFVDISRHSTSDVRNNEIFGTGVKTIEELSEIRKKMRNCKMRIQCVTVDIDDISKLNEFAKTYHFADDLSFRRLMKLNKEFGHDYDVNESSYDLFIRYALDHWTFKEQTIQDYYVYEIFNNGHTDITFSYSDMAMLRKVEKIESDEVFREFIVHPDGTVSGSWKKDKKILLVGGVKHKEVIIIK